MPLFFTPSPRKNFSALCPPFSALRRAVAPATDLPPQSLNPQLPWDGLGRPVGRVESAKSLVFTGLGTTGRVYRGERGVAGREAHQAGSEILKPRPTAGAVRIGTLL